MFAQHFVLGEEQSLDGSHERAAFASEVADGLALECGLEKVT